MSDLIKKHEWTFAARLRRTARSLIRFDAKYVIFIYSVFGSVYFSCLTRLSCLRPPRAGYYVICMPRGGLNDVLCQIKRAIYYGILHRRRLIVCSDCSTIGPIQCLFSFENLENIDFQTPSQLINNFEGIDTFPPLPLKTLVESKSDFGHSDLYDGFLTFDFRKAYRELLLFHSGRGGGFGLDLMAHLRLKPLVAENLRKEVEKLPHIYDAIQIRNTDITTNWHELLKAPTLFTDRLPLLICSDDDQVIRYIQSRFSGFRKVISLRPLREERSGNISPIHYDVTQSIESRNFHMLLDLFSLSLSRKLFVASTYADGLSGFPRLAKSLHLYPSLVKRIMLM